MYFFFIKDDGKFRIAYQHTAAEYIGPYSFSDGNWHTVIVSDQNEKAMRLTIDGQEVWNNTKLLPIKECLQSRNFGSGHNRCSENKDGRV
ncbi:MAG: hypothetical protein ACLTKE_12210 [Coprococcus sp.]